MHIMFQGSVHQVLSLHLYNQLLLGLEHSVHWLGFSILPWHEIAGEVIC